MGPKRRSHRHRVNTYYSAGGEGRDLCPCHGYENEEVLFAGRSGFVIIPVIIRIEPLVGIIDPDPVYCCHTFPFRAVSKIIIFCEIEDDRRKSGQ
jgi:hypothetical protein